MPNHNVEAVLTAVTGGLDGAEDRPGQVTMANAVAEAIHNHTHLVVQAGTGTGKSLAYLVPAVLSGRRTVVATATKALQDQLADKDLPFLHDKLAELSPPVAFTSAVLKGRSNYVCAQRLDEIARSSSDRLFETVGDADPVQLEAIQEWASGAVSGDMADLDIAPTTETWSAVSVSARECPGAEKCPAGDRCFAEAARKRAAAADVIVVNLHLYGTHLGAETAVLPPHDVLVVDEAHVFEDVLSSTLGVEMTPARLTFAARTVASLLDDPAPPASLLSAATQLESAAAAHAGERVDPPDEPLRLALNLGRLAGENALTAVRAVPDVETGDTATRKARAMNVVLGVMEDLDTLLEPRETSVRFVDGNERSPRLRAAPLDVANVLNETLWADDITAVLTSATLPPKLPERLGLREAHTELDVGSPFDYEHQALLYCATTLPDPRSEGFPTAAAQEMDALVRAAGGRALLLFTSWRAMNEAYESIGTALPFPALRQGDLPKPVLVQRFADEPSSVLFATMGYWQGIDIPGPSLTLVTIDKLPFARPNDPLFQARRDAAGPMAFQLIDIPRAATLLAQGVGRLIRRRDDEGVIAVMDRRLSTAKSYRWDLIRALPPMRRTADRAEAIDTLRRLRRQAEAAGR